MVFIEVPDEQLTAFKAHLEHARIRMSIGYLPHMRMVTHLDIDDAAIARTIAAFTGFFRCARRPLAKSPVGGYIALRVSSSKNVIMRARHLQLVCLLFGVGTAFA